METLRLVMAVLSLGSLWATFYLYIKGIKTKQFKTANIALIVCLAINALRILVENL